MSEMDPVISDRPPRFSQFVQWAFYASLVVLASITVRTLDGILDRLASLDVNVAALNVQMGTSIERMGWQQKLIDHNSDRIDKIDNRVNVLERSIK